MAIGGDGREGGLRNRLTRDRPSTLCYRTEHPRRPFLGVGRLSESGEFDRQALNDLYAVKRVFNLGIRVVQENTE